MMQAFQLKYFHFSRIHSVKIMLLFAMLVALGSSCTTVKEYQKNKLNDSEMVLSNRKIEKTELSFLSY